MAQDLSILPADLPVPTDDGAADHLPGAAVPALELPATTGGMLRVDRPPAGATRLVLYAYSRTGEPGAEPLRSDWDQIPGARGCTPQACDFRDRAGELAELGAATFDVAGQTLLRRLTLIVRDGRIEHVWYPVFPPDRHAEQVLDWLRAVV